ncbi:hypothetical protein DL93DRAFT_2165770 [Clavulina sp. PMI_390]|nr:hypothetical protein DL93DRAFT_2165770 [Clavulina sp. PMI_390]
MEAKLIVPGSFPTAGTISAAELRQIATREARLEHVLTSSALENDISYLNIPEESVQEFVLLFAPAVDLDISQCTTEFMLLPGGRYAIGLAVTIDDSAYLALWDVLSSEKRQLTSYMEENVLGLAPAAVTLLSVDFPHTPSTNVFQAQWDELEHQVTIMQIHPTFSQQAAWFTSAYTIWSLCLEGDTVSMTTWEHLILWDWRENKFGRLSKSTVRPESHELRGRSTAMGHTFLHTAYGEDAHLVVTCLPALSPLNDNEVLEILPLRIGSIIRPDCTKTGRDDSRLVRSDSWIPHSSRRPMRWLWMSSFLEYHVFITNLSNSEPSLHASAFEREFLVAESPVTLSSEAEASISIHNPPWQIGECMVYFQDSLRRQDVTLSGYLISAPIAPTEKSRARGQSFVNVIPTQGGTRVNSMPSIFGTTSKPRAQRFQIRFPTQERRWGMMRVVGVCPTSGTFLAVHSGSRALLARFE